MRTRAVFLWPKDADSPADGLSGGLVVPGDDDHANPGLLATLDGILHFGTGRVQHPNHTHKRHVALARHLNSLQRVSVRCMFWWIYLVLDEVFGVFEIHFFSWTGLLDSGHAQAAQSISSCIRKLIH